MRLTKKYINSFDVVEYYTSGKLSSGIVYIDDNKNWTNLAIGKLGRLEDVEEELGIDLVFLTKLKQGTICYYNSIYGILECEITDIMLLSKKVVCRDKKKERSEVYTARIYELTLEWYGKEWALTKEELE